MQSNTKTKEIITQLMQPPTSCQSYTLLTSEISDYIYMCIIAMISKCFKPLFAIIQKYKQMSLLQSWEVGNVGSLVADFNYEELKISTRRCSRKTKVISSSPGLWESSVEELPGDTRTESLARKRDPFKHFEVL